VTLERGEQELSRLFVLVAPELRADLRLNLLILRLIEQES
jgi:hypothetical protein